MLQAEIVFSCLHFALSNYKFVLPRADNSIQLSTIRLTLLLVWQLMQVIRFVLLGDTTFRMEVTNGSHDSRSEGSSKSYGRSLGVWAAALLAC